VSTWQPSELQRERIAYRRGRARRSTLIAVVSSVALLALVAVGIGSTPGWPRVRATFFDFHRGWEALPVVAQGLWLNIRVMLICAVLIVIFGMTLAIMRTLRGPIFFPLRVFAAAYTDVFRGLPLLLVIFLLGFGVPALQLRGLPNQAVIWGGAALVLTYSSYVAEVFRAGIESVHPSQLAASRSLGLTYRQTMRHVVLPQAIRRVAPPLLNDTVALQKDVGLISLAGPVDAVRAAQIQTAEHFNYTPYIVAAVLFVLLALPLIAVTDAVTLRAARRQNAGA
jgi:polar amino acid transport system permease protein